mmetsp:Transcript_102620/g.221487  ORF Transcript_102620/g.221487 Transcript_102620/m.221487 type:complete len:436 (-) Transcript_102620:7-1314(-)
MRTAASASWPARPRSGRVRTARPRMRRECGVPAPWRSRSSMATQRVTSGWRSSHSQISASRAAPRSFVTSWTAGSLRCCRSPSNMASFPASLRQVLERTMEAPVERTMRSRCVQQLSRKRSSPYSECKTPSMSRKMTAFGAVARLAVPAPSPGAASPGARWLWLRPGSGPASGAASPRCSSRSCSVARRASNAADPATGGLGAASLSRSSATSARSGATRAPASALSQGFSSRSFVCISASVACSSPLSAEHCLEAPWGSEVWGASSRRASRTASRRVSACSSLLRASRSSTDLSSRRVASSSASRTLRSTMLSTRARSLPRLARSACGVVAVSFAGLVWAAHAMDGGRGEERSTCGQDASRGDLHQDRGKWATALFAGEAVPSVMRGGVTTTAAARTEPQRSWPPMVMGGSARCAPAGALKTGRRGQASLPQVA